MIDLFCEQKEQAKKRARKRKKWYLFRSTSFWGSFWFGAHPNGDIVLFGTLTTAMNNVHKM